MAEPATDLAAAEAAATDLLRDAYLGAAAAHWDAESVLAGCPHPLAAVARTRLGRTLRLATQTRALMQIAAAHDPERPPVSLGDAARALRATADGADEAAAAVQRAFDGVSAVIDLLCRQSEREAALTTWIAAQERLGQVARSLAAGRRMLHAYADVVHLGPGALAGDPCAGGHRRAGLRALLRAIRR